jgi:hypothetical protein
MAEGIKKTRGGREYLWVTGTLSFPKFDELQYSDSDKEKENGKYTANIILDPGKYPLLQGKVKSGVIEAFNDSAMALLSQGKIKCPVKKNETFVSDEGERRKGYEEDGLTIVVTMWDEMEFLDQFGNKIMSNSRQARDVFYAGCKVKVFIADPTFQTYEDGSTKVKYGRILLAGLMKKAEGEKLGGGFTAPDTDDIFDDEDFEEPDVGLDSTSDEPPETEDGDDDLFG